MGSYLREKLRAAGISLRGFGVALTVKRGELRKVSQKMSIRCVLRGVSGTIPAMHRQGSQPPGGYVGVHGLSGVRDYGFSFRTIQTGGLNHDADAHCRTYSVRAVAWHWHV